MLHWAAHQHKVLAVSRTSPCGPFRPSFSQRVRSHCVHILNLSQRHNGVQVLQTLAINVNDHQRERTHILLHIKCKTHRFTVSMRKYSNLMFLRGQVVLVCHICQLTHAFHYEQEPWLIYGNLYFYSMVIQINQQFMKTVVNTLTTL